MIIIVQLLETQGELYTGRCIALLDGTDLQNYTVWRK